MLRTVVAVCLVFTVASNMVAGSIANRAKHMVRARGREVPGLTRREEGRWRGPFFFIQLSDPQFGFTSNNRGFRAETVLTERAVAHVNRLRPRFVVVTGDLVNAWRMDTRHHLQVAEYRRVLGKVDPAIPVFSVCGNHDVTNRPTPQTIASFTRTFGDDYFAFWVGGVRFLALNSSLFADGARAPEQLERQRRWLRRRLAETEQLRPRHTLVFQHHPWFRFDPDEADSYFNVPRDVRHEALEAMFRAGVRAVFAGHYNHTAWGTYGDMEMVTSGPLSRPLRKPTADGRVTREPPGLRVVKVLGDRVVHRYYALDEVPARVVPPGAEPPPPSMTRETKGAIVPADLTIRVTTWTLALLVIGLSVFRRRRR